MTPEETKDRWNAVGVDRDDLIREFAELPAWIAHFGEKYAEAAHDRDMADLDLKREHYRLYLLRKHMAEAGTKRPTEATIEAEIIRDPHWLDLKLAAISAEARVADLKIVLDALRAKKDMLVQLGAQSRFDEGNQDPTMRSRSEDR